MDAADIWGTPCRSDVAVQAQGGRPHTSTNDIAGKFGNYAQCHVLGYVRRHIPRCGRIRVSSLSTVMLFWLISRRMARLLLCEAKCASCAGWTAAYTQVAARCARLQAVLLARWLLLRHCRAYRGKAPARRPCDVCVAEGPRECVGCGARQRAGFSDWEARECIGEFCFNMRVIGY